MHILAPYISCICLPHELEEAIAQEYKEIYIFTSEGILKHHVLRGEGRFVRTKVDKIPGYTEPKLGQGMNFLPAGKIPYALFEQVQAFFRKVMTVKTAELEAMIHILWNKDQGYHLGVPPQRISKASVSYDWSYIPQGTSIVVDIHSHNTMSAFFSGTDDRDDRGNISFSGVFGKLKDKIPMTVWRFNYFDKKYDAKIEDLFEDPELPEVEVPEEWMNQVEVYTYTPTYPVGGYSNQGNAGRGQSPAGRSPSDLAKWRYPTTQTQSPAANRAANHAASQGSFPSPAGNAKRFDPTQDIDGDAEASLLHFFGLDESGYANYGVPARGIPTATEVGEDDDIPFAFEGTTNRPSRMVEEPSDPPISSISAIEDPDGEEADPVGKSSGELALWEEARNSLTGTTDAELDPAYEAIRVIHGEEVADAWRDIAYSMSTLDGKDELNRELICDMAGLSTEDGQLAIVRALFERLSPSNREKLQTQGL